MDGEVFAEPFLRNVEVRPGMSCYIVGIIFKIANKITNGISRYPELEHLAKQCVSILMSIHLP